MVVRILYDIKRDVEVKVCTSITELALQLQFCFSKGYQIALAKEDLIVMEDKKEN